jgi:hypothetical protein
LLAWKYVSNVVQYSTAGNDGCGRVRGSEDPCHHFSAQPL